MASSPSNASHNLPNHEDRYLILVEFAHRHLDFLMQELEAILEMNGVVLGGDECRLEPLANQSIFDQTIHSISNKDAFQKLAKRPYALLSFAADSKWAPKVDAGDNDDADDDNPQRSCIGTVLLERCVLVRNVIELWGMATTVEECAAKVKSWTHGSPRGKWMWQRQRHVDRSWKVSVQTLGARYKLEEQAAMRDHFNFLDFEGPVQMKDPTDEYILIREVELDYQGGAIFPRLNDRKQLIPENDARPPLCCYFGRIMGELENNRPGRGMIDQYTLKKRKYLGPTSMDTELSFVMANLGHVRKESMVLDPFVGTGSILIPCALRGAYCVGTDIDIRVLRGKGGDNNVFANFQQYNLPRPELIRSDNAMYDHHFRNSTKPLYDAIVCDPPYGIRAGARMTGTKKRVVKEVSEDQRQDHIPQTKPYPVSDVMADLLNVAARTLVMGGRLVYIIPSYAEFDEESDLPRHPCFKTSQICYQPLSLELGRRLVAMEKVAEYDINKEKVYKQFIWKNGAESADKCANIREKLIEAAKQKPGYQEKLAVRKQKRKLNKEAKKRAKLAEQEQSASNS